MAAPVRCAHPVFKALILHAKLGAARLLPAHSSYTDPSGDINDTSTYFDFSRLRGYLKTDPTSQDGALVVKSGPMENGLWNL